jgi:hypothetical protein
MPTIDQVITKYVQLRDEQAQMSARHEEELAPIVSAMDKIKQWLLAKLNEEGAQNFKTPAGTAYKVVKTSVTVGNEIEFRRFIMQPAVSALAEQFKIDASIVEGVLSTFCQWGLADFRAGKKGITEYVEEGHMPPPGINIKQFVDLNVKRA